MTPAEQVPSAEALDELTKKLARQFTIKMCRDAADAIAALRAALARAERPPTNEEADALISAAVDKFLSWELPRDFDPDCGISFKYEHDARGNVPSWPIGTNLFTAQQARAMLEYACADLLWRIEFGKAKHRRLIDKANQSNRLIGEEYARQIERAESAERERDALRLAVDSLVAEREALAQERDGALLPRFDEVPEDCPIGPQCLAVGNCLRRCSAAIDAARGKDAPTYVDGPVDPDGAIK